MIFKLTPKQRFVTEFLHSSHIQYDILCYSVILITVLSGKDEIRTSHKPTIVSKPKIGMGLVICVFCLFRSIWIKLLCCDHTNNMTSGSNIFIAFLLNLSSSLSWFYETNNHLNVCENMDHQSYFLSLVVNPVTIKLAYWSGTNELAKQNVAIMGNITMAKRIKNWIAIYWLIVA